MIASAESQWSFRLFSIPDGGPVGRVSEVTEDVDGAIWVATWGEGVHRIHGTAWKTFTEADGLPDDWIRNITTAPGGGVWVSTGDGLAHIKGDRMTTLTPENVPALPESDIAYARELADGSLWVSTFGGWALVHRPLQEGARDYQSGWTTLAEPPEVGRNTFSDLVEVAPGKTLLSFRTERRAWVDNDNAIRFETGPGDPQWYTFFMGVIREKPTLWAASRQDAQLLEYDGTDWRELPPTPLRTNALGQDSDGTMYAATHTGLYQQEAESWRPVEMDPSLGTPNLLTMLIARDGSVWLGGAEGLIRGVPRPWAVLRKGSDSEVPLGAVARTNLNEPVIGIDGRGTLYRPRGKAWKRQCQLAPWTPDSLMPSDAIWLSDGQLWIDPDSKICWMTLLNGRLHQIFGEEYCIYRIEDGALLQRTFLPPLASSMNRYFLTQEEQLWSLTEQGLYELDGSWKILRPLGDMERNWVNVIVQNGPGDYWVGLETGGIERWIGDEVIGYGTDFGINIDNSINTICRTRGGDVWFGSVGSGLYHFDGDQFVNYTKADGLRSNAVRSIFESSDGAIWVAYRSSGVSVLREGRWVHYAQINGLPNAAVLRFSETEDTSLWVGGQDGALYRYQSDTNPPETSVRLGPETVDHGGVGIFSITGRDSWDLTPASDLYFSWRVVPAESIPGREPGWSPFSRETTVATGALTPGEYVFEVRSSDEHGNIDEEPATHAFVMAPPLWQKPVFFVPLFCSILLAMSALYARHRSHRALRASEAQLKRHRDNLEELVQERTHDLELAQGELLRKERLATLGELTATVSHELRNPLGTIQSSIYMIKKRAADKGLDIESAIERTMRSVKRCDHIVEEMLDYTRSQAIETVAIHWDGWLQDTLEEIEIGSGITRHVNLNSGSEVCIDPELMRRVLINVLDNAVQAMETHGGPEKCLNVATAQMGDRVITYVEDTGPGIPEDALEHILEPLYSTKNFGVGLGTNIVKNIMERHGGGVDYGNVPGSGARVQFWLPKVSLDKAELDLLQ